MRRRRSVAYASQLADIGEARQLSHAAPRVSPHLGEGERRVEDPLLEDRLDSGLGLADLRGDWRGRAGADGEVDQEDPLRVDLRALVARSQEEPVAEDRPVHDSPVGSRDEELRGVDEHDARAVLPRPGLHDRIVRLRAEHAARRAEEEARSALEEAPDHLPVAAVRAGMRTPRGP